MRLVVLGISGAAPETMLAHEDLPNLRRLMELGCYGRLESVVPSGEVPTWMCMATGQDPGSLGVYGPLARADRARVASRAVDWNSIDAPAIWDVFEHAGKRSIVIGTPPAGPRRDGIVRFADDFLNVPSSATAPRDDVESIAEASRRRFEEVGRLMRTGDWDYFQYVDRSLDLVRRAVWKRRDSGNAPHLAVGLGEDVVLDHYRRVDEEIGGLFETLDENTGILALSTHGARRSDGVFHVNDWLVEQGLLVLNSRPDGIAPFASISVDWRRTTCWSEGGFDAPVFFNVKGREPDGFIEPADLDRAREDVAARIAAIEGSDGRPLGLDVFTPERTYRAVRNVAPDLILHAGSRAWRSVAEVGRSGAHAVRDDASGDDCGPSQFGAFILASPGRQPHGEVEGVHLLDLAPTLLELAGLDVPKEMGGRSLSRRADASGPADDLAGDDEAAIMDRLSGLGYV